MKLGKGWKLFFKEAMVLLLVLTLAAFQLASRLCLGFLPLKLLCNPLIRSAA